MAEQIRSQVFRGLEALSRGTAKRPRPDLLPRSAVQRDRAHRRLPGRHGQDASLPRTAASARAPPGGSGSRSVKARILPLDSAEHRSAQDLLPWFVNGTLGAGEASSVARHIADCERCQKDAAEQAQLRASASATQVARRRRSGLGRAAQPDRGYCARVGRADPEGATRWSWRRWLPLTVAIQASLDHRARPGVDRRPVARGAVSRARCSAGRFRSQCRGRVPGRCDQPADA